MHTASLPTPADRHLYRWEKAAVALLAVLAVAFGGLTLLRSAYQDTRKTDFGVYARAAWAVRTDHDPYRVTDDNGWHYVYPPPFVLLFLPLADPPDGADRAGYLAYPLGVFLWYGIGVLLLGYALHTFAVVCLPDAQRWSRRWWYARLLPFDVCVASLGFTLARGQANILLVALIAGAFAAAIRSHPIRSGAFLAGAACLKVFPALLVLFPVVRREWRSAVGYVGGAAVLLFVLPALAWGPSGAIRQNVRFLQLVVAPGLFESDTQSTEDKLLAKELHNMTAKDSQSFVATLHYWRYPDTATRPAAPDPDTRAAHWLLSAFSIGVTVLAGMRLRRGQLDLANFSKALTPGPSPSDVPRCAGTGERGEKTLSRLAAGEGDRERVVAQQPGEGHTFGNPTTKNRRPSASDWLVFLGCLIAVMLLVVPVSHFHYYAILTPLAAGLVCRSLANDPRRAVPDSATLAVLTLWALATSVPLLDFAICERMRTGGVGPVATLLLWAFGVGTLTRRTAVAP